MITIQELIDDLAYGELHNIKFANSGEATLDGEQLPRVISAINIGLHKIYSRFNFRERSINLHQQAGVTRYFLRKGFSDYAGNLDSETYLEETEDRPFENDVLKVISAKDSAGLDVKVNDRNYPCDIFTPDYDVIDIAEPSSTRYNADHTQRTTYDTFTLTYRARYPKIILTPTFKPEKFKLQIPDAIVDALLIFIAYKLFRKPVKVAKGEISPTQNLLAEFNNELARIDLDNVDIDTLDTVDKIARDGWA